MEDVKYKICYWYHEYQDMSASVPTCDYYRQYGECPCEPECEHFIAKKEVDDIVRNMGKIGQTSDLIRRQDALKPFCIAPDGTRIPEVDCDNLPVEFSVEFIKKHLLSLPSAEATKKKAELKEDGDWDCPDVGCDECDHHRSVEWCSLAIPNYEEKIDETYKMVNEAFFEGFDAAEKQYRFLIEYVEELDKKSVEAENKHYIKIYADDEPSVKAEKLYQICGETQNKEVTEWLKEYFPLSYDNWIPVSEKLPDEDDYNEYLVIDDRGYMAVGNYRHDAKAWDSGNFGWLEIRDKADEFPWGIGKVIAWYKPKPYEESEVEE